MSKDDINRAVLEKQKAVALTSDGHPDYTTFLASLGIALHYRFQLTGSMEDINSAIASHEQAIESTAESHPSLPGHLSNLGLALRLRFQETK